MKYIYRDECPIIGADVSGIVFVLLLLCGDLALLFAGLVSYFQKGDATLLTNAAAAALVPAAMAATVGGAIHRRRKRARAKRRKALTLGAHYSGKIIESGMEMEKEAYDLEDKNGNRKTSYRNVPNYWVNVEYFDPETGETQLLRAHHMVKEIDQAVGCAVDVYIWRERSGYIKADITYSYIALSVL